jgi:hypothetical protein
MIKACCKAPKNRALISVKYVEQQHGKMAEARVEQCVICQCKHHRLKVNARFEPGKFVIG